MRIFGPKGLIKKLFGQRISYTPEQLYSKAQDLLKNGQTEDGYTYLRASALNGHAEAAFQVALAVSENELLGTMEDAVRYYSIASEKGHAQATTNLAICYQLGNGTDVDHVKAIHLLNKAVKLGDDMAIFNLAQTYLLGVGVKKDETKGWLMLESLAAKGNKRALDYMNNLKQNGFNILKENFSNMSSGSLCDKLLDNNITDYAPECTICDSKILAIYNLAKGGNKSAIDELLDLGGNRMNREAMNALRKLGIIKEDISNDFKFGSINYIASAWKTYDVEPLYILCSWTYPGFIYREYKNDTILYETVSEVDFIGRIANEISNCKKQNIIPMFRVREVDTSSVYCVDVMIKGVSLSSFYLDIKDDHFVGIYRLYDNAIE